MTSVHLYTRPRQPATRWVDLSICGREPVVHRTKPNRLLTTTCCRKRRPARNLEVQVYYDQVLAWCRPGTGCRIPRRRRPSSRILARDSQRGLSTLGLARKYGMPQAEVETRLWQWSRRRGKA